MSWWGMSFLVGNVLVQLGGECLGGLVGKGLALNRQTPRSSHGTTYAVSLPCCRLHPSPLRLVLFGPTYPRRTKISHLGGRATYLLGRDIGPAGGQATYLPYPLGTQSMLVLEPHSVLRAHQDCSLQRVD